jgi:hypothetical protein
MSDAPVVDSLFGDVISPEGNRAVVSAAASPVSIIPVERVLQAVIDAAANPAVDVAKMRELLGLQKELMTMQAEQQFNQAFDRLDLPRIKKNGIVEYKGKEAFRFATWEGIMDAILPLLKAEGFSLWFDSVPRQGDGGGLIVTGTLSHIAGHRRSASIPVPLDTSGGKNNIQGYGSAMSYGKRYTTTSLLNIVTEGEDDDGVRGGRHFIEPEQVQELSELCKRAGRQETPFVQRLFGGEFHAFHEIEQGSGFLAAKSTLVGIIEQQAAKKQDAKA